MAYNSAERVDVYSRITNKIIHELEQGTRPWMKPWSNKTPDTNGIVRPLRHNGVPYRGINVLMLWGEQMASGFASPYWLTYQQATEYGGHVRKGERGSLVVYASKYTKTETNDSGEEIERNIPFLRGYTVFNASQCEELRPERFGSVSDQPLPEPLFKRIENAESFVSHTEADIRHGGNQAFHHYDPSYIQMPPFAAFRDAESYYGTLLHELTHWTRVPHRLNRDFGRKRWGDSGYAAEELVAEIGSAFLCADLGISLEPRPDHASYIESWLKVLRDDKRAIFTAASHAQAAADYIHGLQPKIDSEPVAAELSIAA